MIMKKILLLGGSAQQITVIETAKKLGYYTILCDFLTDNPGQYHADRFYLVSTTDKEAVLKVAKEEAVDGVLAYASDPAAPTAAYVAEKMELPGTPYETVQILCNKDLFRKFLSEHGFNSPKANGYSSTEDALQELKWYRLPIIIKPVDSSGSKGATVLWSLENAEEALSFAFSFSRTHRIIVEEYVEKKHPYLIGGDIFVSNGKVVLWGLLNCHRDQDVNPLVPVGKSYPLQLEDADIACVKETLQRMIQELHVKNSALNVELVVDKNGLVWPIDVGPRSGGNMIPELLDEIFKIDIPEMCVKAAMGEKNEEVIGIGEPYYATHNLHAHKSGIFQKVAFSAELEKYIIKKCIYKKPGDEVDYFDNASKALGIIFMKFDNADQMFKMLKNINEHIFIHL
jgi:carbamoylphosphate synthase large subunit